MLEISDTGGATMLIVYRRIRTLLCDVEVDA